MPERTERRSRHRECLELEAQYGQFISCEGYAHPDDLERNRWSPGRGTVASPMMTALLDGFRALREALRGRCQTQQ